MTSTSDSDVQSRATGRRILFALGIFVVVGLVVVLIARQRLRIESRSARAETPATAAAFLAGPVRRDAPAARPIPPRRGGQPVDREGRPPTQPTYTSKPGAGIPDVRIVLGNALFVRGDEGKIRTWDFGDDTSSFSRLTGYNAAHVYDAEGDYTITESDADGANPTTKLLRVLPEERNTIEVQPGTNLETLFKKLKGNVKVLLPRGSEFEIRDSLPIHGAMTFVGAYGEGEAPVLRHVGTREPIFFVDAANFSVDGIVFDTDVPIGVNPQKVARYGIFIRKGSATVLRCKFRNVDNGVQCSPGTSGLLVQQCLFTDEMRSCDVWLDGKDMVLLGNKGGNSRFEHNVRCSAPDAVRVLVHGNDFSNPPVGTKETLTFRDGQYFYASANVFRYGWVQASEGRANAEQVCRHVVFEGNTLTDGAFFQINPGAQDVLVKNNTIIVAPGGGGDAVRVTGPYTDNIRIENNKRIVKGEPKTPFLQFYSSPDGVTENDNSTVPE